MSGIEERLLEIAKLRSAAERDIALKDLKAETGATLGSLRADLARYQQGLAELRLAESLGPHLEELHRQGWFMILQGNRVWVGRLANSRLNGHAVRKLELLAPADFVVWVHHMDPASRPEASPGRAFLRHPDTPHYDGTTIDPKGGLDAGGKLNLWMGFGVEPRPDPERAAVFRAHVALLCGGEGDLSEYLLDWIAWGFQHPEQTIGTAPILIGEPGTGKGMLGNLLTAIWGSHGLTLRDKRSIVGDFNSHLAQCAFGFVDEALFVGDRSIGDRMKGLITEPTLQVEAKFQQRVEVTNMLKLMMATNHDHAMLIDPNDRRYVVIRVPETMPASGDPYWRGFVATCHSVEGRGAILADMLGRDVSRFRAEADRPDSDAYVGQKRASLHDDLLYWRHVIDEATLTPGEPAADRTAGEWPTETAPGDVAKSRLYGYYASFHRRHVRGTPVDTAAFWKTALAIGLVVEGGRSREYGQRVRRMKVASYADMDEALTAFLARPRLR